MNKEEMKSILVDIWKDLFQLKEADDDMDFFSLGGDSLKALQLSDALKKKGIKIDVMDVFTYSRLSDMAGFLKENTDQDASLSSKDQDMKYFGIFRQPLHKAAETAKAGIGSVHEAEKPDDLYTRTAHEAVYYRDQGTDWPGRLIRNLAEENQTRKILDILNFCADLEEAKERVRDLLARQQTVL